MSSLPALPGGGQPPGGISDVVSQDDLTRWAQIAGVLKYLTAPLDPPPPADSPSSIAVGTIASVFRNTAAAGVEAGIDNAITHKMAAGQAIAAGAVGTWTAMFVQFCFLVIGPILDIVLGVLDGIRKGADPQVGQLAVTIMNEFLGTDFGLQQMPFGIGTGDHISRARVIGNLLYTQLETEFALGGGQIVPSLAPAQTFSGIAVNFGLASGLMGVLGGMVPAGFHLEEMRELGEEVARNIGLGRLVRRALTPLITTLVSNPAQWALNMKYRPTQFKEAELVNPFLGTQLPRDQLYNAMHLLGYSDDKIQAFIEMHEKRLTPADVQTLINWGFWTAEEGADYVQRQGWPAGFAGNVLTLEGFREVRPWITKEIDVLLSEVESRQITVTEFAQVIDGFAISPQEKNVVVALANYRAAKSHIKTPARLSEGELFYAFAAGLLTDSEVRDRWTLRGLTPDDQDVRMSLWLLHLNRLQELEKEKLDAYQAKQIEFQKKQAGAKKVLSPPIVPVPPFPLG